MQLVFLWMLACGEGGGVVDTGDPAGGDGGSDPIEDPEVEAALGFTLSQAPLAPTALVASWDLGGGPEDPMVEDLVVEVDRGDGAPYELPAALESRRRILVGFKPDHQVAVRLLATVNGQRGATAWQEVDTGVLPADLAAIQVDAAQPGSLDGGVLLVAQVQNPPAILALDGDGDLVWWRIMDDPSWLSRVRLSADGERILAFDGLNTGGASARVRSFGLDGELLSELSVDGSHHDFTQLPDGTLAIIAWDQREIDGEIVWGDRIVELAPDGSQTELWSVFDSFAYSPDLDHIEGQEWTHANSLEYDLDTDSYLLTLPGLSSVVALGRQDATPDWVMGGDFSDFTDAKGKSTFFGFIHGVDLLDGSLLIFENNLKDSTSSSAIEMEFDLLEGRAQEAWRYTPDPSVSTPTLGNVFRLDGGNTVVNFATAGRITELLPDGSVGWQVSTGLGDALGYATFVPDFR